jgi:uncharacterized repeat protein (TIGR01451 family)
MQNKGLITTSFTMAIVTLMIFSAIAINAGNGGIPTAKNIGIIIAGNPENVPTANAETASTSLPSGISIWEAYAKGYASIASGAYGDTYIITNTGAVNVIVDEYAMIMSPNPYESGSENPTGIKWAQDGVFTNGTITSASSLTYNYGDKVVGALQPKLPPPPWWCTEDSELTAPNVQISLTGEIIPFDLWDGINNPNGTLIEFDRGDVKTKTSVTQAGIWRYLRDNAAPVIGKTPMWKLIPNLPTEIDISLAVTNIGFQAASSVIVKDTLPSGYKFKSGSANPSTSSITTNPDGSTELTWTLGSLRGAIQTNDTDPTDYAHIYITYTLETPELVPDSRYFLPRAKVDKNDDTKMDAHSEEPLLETYFVNRPPVPRGNNPIIDEGQTASLEGTQSYDPDETYGDYIVSYEWDLDNDGTVDATGQNASKEYGDNGIFPVTLTVTDSYGAQTSTMVNITVLNVAPTIYITAESQFVEVSLRVAGSKWSNVEMTLYEDDNQIGYIEVERWPGSPKNNPTYGNLPSPILFNRTKIYKAIVTYDPYPDNGDKIKGDQPNNGKDKKDNAGNPVWIVLTSENGTTTKIHHTFNTEQSKIKKSKHWNHIEPWEVELNKYMPGLKITLDAIAYDPGADDLNCFWEFDDGTTIIHDYPNSGGVYPVNVIDTVDYNGPASSVKLTVTDDDGGVVTETLSL